MCWPWPTDPPSEQALGETMPILTVLAVNAGVCVALFALLWLAGLRLRDVTFVDAF